MANWDKELAKIDKQLASLPDDEPRRGSGMPGGSAPLDRSGRGGGVSGAPAASARAATYGVAFRLGLSAALGVAIVFWPYEARCGAGLAAYLASVLVVAGGGLWSAIWSWRHRSGRAHTVAILLLMWGLVLAGAEVLPRLGYAKPDARHPAVWACQ